MVVVFVVVEFGHGICHDRSGHNFCIVIVVIFMYLVVVVVDTVIVVVVVVVALVFCFCGRRQVCA